MKQPAIALLLPLFAATACASEPRHPAAEAGAISVAVASAHESFIQSLYAHNLAKVELARAIGDAEQGVDRYLKGRHQ